MESSDPCAGFPLAIDVAGDRYYLGAERPVELGYKSRRDFITAFGTDSAAECLIRKYMYIGNNPLKVVFDSSEEKDVLIQVLEKRANALRSSNKFNSSILANTVIQRNYSNLVKLIEGLKGEDYVPSSRNYFAALKRATGKLAEARPSVLKPTKEYKDYAMKISDDAKFQLILEMAWYLMHPELVPQKAQRRWFKLVKRLDTMRLEDLTGLSGAIQALKGTDEAKPILNYFKSINLKDIMDAAHLEDITKDKLTTAVSASCETDKDKMRQRLEVLLKLLATKGYLQGNSINAVLNISKNDSVILSDLSGSILRSVQAGGAAAEMTEGLRQSMLPLFDYFSGMYDPVYSVLDDAIDQMDDANKPSIVEIVRLLHIITKLNIDNDPTKYGVYRVKGISPTVIQFVENLIKSTQQHTDKLEDDEKKQYFEDLEVLPRIRLSTVVNQFSKTYKDPKKLPFVSLMTLGSAFTIPDEEVMEDPNNGIIYKSMKSHGVSSANKTLSSLNFGQFNEAIKAFFNENVLYIVSNSENEKIPLRLFDIDTSEIELDDTAVSGVEVENNYLNMLLINDVPLFMEDILDVDLNNILNDASFALATFISLKEIFSN